MTEREAWLHIAGLINDGMRTELSGLCSAIAELHCAKAIDSPTQYAMNVRIEDKLIQESYSWSDETTHGFCVDLADECEK